MSEKPEKKKFFSGAGGAGLPCLWACLHAEFSLVSVQACLWTGHRDGKIANSLGDLKTAEQSVWLG